MKKSFLVILSAAMILGGCGGSGTSAATNTEKAQESASETADMQKETTQKETTEAETTVPPKEVKELSVEEFDELLSGLPVSVVKSEYLVQDEQYKSLYPDMLNAVIQNNTDADIKDAVLAFVAWDSNHLPVKLVGNMDFSGGDYFAEVNYRQGGTGQAFLDKLYDLIDFLLPNYIREGKNQLVVAVGCTGGKHRSVAMANALFGHLA